MYNNASVYVNAALPVSDVLGRHAADLLEPADKRSDDLVVVCGRLESCDILSNVLLLTKFCQVLFYLGHGLVVMGGDSCSEGREFEFFPYFVCKNCNV